MCSRIFTIKSRRLRVYPVTSACCGTLCPNLYQVRRGLILRMPYCILYGICEMLDTRWITHTRIYCIFPGRRTMNAIKPSKVRGAKCFKRRDLPCWERRIPSFPWRRRRLGQLLRPTRHPTVIRNAKPRSKKRANIDQLRSIYPCRPIRQLRRPCMRRRLRQTAQSA